MKKTLRNAIRDYFISDKSQRVIDSLRREPWEWEIDDTTYFTHVLQHRTFFKGKWPQRSQRAVIYIQPKRFSLDIRYTRDTLYRFGVSGEYASLYEPLVERLALKLAIKKWLKTGPHYEPDENDI